MILGTMSFPLCLSVMRSEVTCSVFRVVLSPPMSPNRVSADDEIHIRSIVEAVCQTQEIGPNAVEKLCSHANADEQEQQVQSNASNCFVKYVKMGIMLAPFRVLMYICVVYVYVHMKTKQLLSHEESRK